MAIESLASAAAQRSPRLKYFNQQIQWRVCAMFLEGNTIALELSNLGRKIMNEMASDYIESQKRVRPVFGLVFVCLSLIVSASALPVNIGSERESELKKLEFFVGHQAVKVTPAALPVSELSKKRIEVDLRKQRLYLYRDDVKIADYVISSGKPSTATKAGHFSIISKYPAAYGGKDGDFWTMPYFMGFYTVGQTENGFHELPFINGVRETSRDLGYPVSHGCVRLGVGQAEIVYNFAEIGTPVWAHY